MKQIVFLISLFCAFNAKAEVSLDDKIAQMIMVGFNNQTLDDTNPIYNDIKNNHIGGVILFDKNADKTQPDLQKNINNPAQLKKLIVDLNSISKTPLFISIDQEGGKVSRLNKSFDVSTYSAKNLGELNNKNLTFSEALKTAQTLKDLGININFAPCVDVEINKDSPITKKQRIFSEDAKIVADNAIEVVKAHKQAGVLPVLKHFPGHGSAKHDSHDGFVDISITFSQEELVPYKKIVKKHPNIGVMTTHVFNENIDSKNPLSLSKKSITDLLKKEIGFNGLVFSDDLNMGALAKNYSWEDVLINAINAGTDILVIGNNLTYNPNVTKQSIKIIKQAVKDNKISANTIDSAYNKIMNYKKGM
ncbi:MAG: glycoside hydrolase family 3 N-terminal domain-containing protein [Alphaproteobacteria bacterium]